MTINVDKAFEVNSGVVVNDESSGNTVEGPFFTGGPNIPLGLNLPEKTIYNQVKSDGIVVWRKFGNGINDWSIQDGELRRDTIDHDLYIPSNTTSVITSREINREVFVDGELYIL
jgi:hypothetical protein